MIVIIQADNTTPDMYAAPRRAVCFIEPGFRRIMKGTVPRNEADICRRMPALP